MLQVGLRKASDLMSKMQWITLTTGGAQPAGNATLFYRGWVGGGGGGGGGNKVMLTIGKLFIVTISIWDI